MVAKVWILGAAISIGCAVAALPAVVRRLERSIVALEVERRALERAQRGFDGSTGH